MKLITSSILYCLFLLTVPVTAQEHNTTELKFWHFMDTELVTDLVQQYQQQHPGIIVTTRQLNWKSGWDQILRAFETGTAPDVIELGSDMVGELLYRKQLLDVTDKVTDLRSTLKMWYPVEYRKKVYGLPWLLDTRVLYYNRSLLKVAQLDPDKPPSTWPELYAICKQLTQTFQEKNMRCYAWGVNGPDKHILYKKILPFIWSNGSDIVSPDGQQCLLDLPESRDAIEFYLSLVPLGIVETQKQLDQLFLEGRVAFWISGSWLLARIRQEKPDFDVGTALIPVPDKKGKSISFAGGEYLVINRKTKVPDYAVDLINFFVQENNTVYLSTTAGMYFPPIDVSDMQKYQFSSQQHTFIVQLNQSMMPRWENQAQWRQIKDIFEKYIGEAVTGKISGSRAITESSRQIRMLLSQKYSR